MPFSYEAVSQVRMPEAQRAMPEGEQTPTRFMPEGVDEDKFYSQLDRVITDKVPTRATAQQIMATIDPTRGSGVKADEIKWSGIEQALASLEKDGKVSKEDLLNYLRNEGRVRFEEVTLGEGRNAYEAERSLLGEQLGRGEITSQEYRRLTDEIDSRTQEQPEAKFSQYVLPGGENYREVVLAMAKTSGYTLRNGRGDIVGTYKNREEALVELKQLKDSDYLANITPTDEVSGYTSSHFPDIPNYVAHMRTNERTLDDGSEGLFVEEFQSDRHQEGRKKGYREDKVEQKLEDFDVESFLREKSNVDGVADAPFRTTWPIQLFKRALRDAVDSGKDWIGFTTAQPHIDRWGTERIEWAKQSDGTFLINAKSQHGGNAAGIDLEGEADARNLNPQNSKTVTTEAQFVEAIRPSLTEGQNPEALGAKLWKKMATEDSGVSMPRKEGFEGFYDNMLPKEVGKYVKQFGGKVEKADMTQSVEPDIMSGEEAETGSIPIWKVNITPEMRKISQTGQMRFMPEGVSPEDLNPVANKQEAQGLWADGKQMFAINEMDEKLIPITSKAMLESYPADAIGWMEPEAQTRFMPEKLDSDYMKAVESGDVEAQQRMVDEAAKKAGYSVKAYHGTPEGGFVTFETQRKNLKEGVGNTADPNTFLGAHFAEEESVARRFMDELYGGNESPKNPQLYGVYLKIQNPLGGDSFVPGDIVATKEVAVQQRSKYKEVKEKIQKLNDELRNKELDANIQGDVNLISSGKISEWVKSKNNESKAKFPKEHSEIEKLKQQADEISSKLGRSKQIQIPNGKTLFLEGDRGLVSEGEFGIEALSNVGTGRNPEAEASKSEDKRWRTAIGRSMRENFDKLGYDAVIYDNAVEGGVSIIVPTPEQIKSADPITRDDSNNVIPLSKRFDVGSRDIRYMPEGENVPNRQKISTKKQPSKLPSRSRIAAVNEDEEQSRRPKRKSTAKGNASAIANAAKLK